MLDLVFLFSFVGLFGEGDNSAKGRGQDTTGQDRIGQESVCTFIVCDARVSRA